MVAVVVTTYNPTPEAPRHAYAQQVLVSLEDYLTCRTEAIRFIISDDGSPSMPLFLPNTPQQLDVVKGPHGGIGASLNRALATVARDELWLYITDDWELQDSLSLSKAVWLIREEDYDFVRLGPIHPNLSCTTKFTVGPGWWLHLNFGDGFVFGTRPFLASKRFYEKVGPFLEGVDAYVCERDYSDRCNAHGGLRAAALNLVGPWEHIGEYEVGDRPV